MGLVVAGPGFQTPWCSSFYFRVLWSYGPPLEAAARQLTGGSQTGRWAAGRKYPIRPGRSAQGWTGPLGPRSRRSDCMMANVVVVVKTSMSAAASTPVYLAMTGAAAFSVTASR